MSSTTRAAGLTPTDLRDQLTTRLSEYLPSPEVAVIVREVHSVKVAVVGAVKIPGRYEIKSPTTVLELLGIAPPADMTSPSLIER